MQKFEKLGTEQFKEIEELTKGSIQFIIVDKDLGEVAVKLSQDHIITIRKGCYGDLEVIRNIVPVVFTLQFDLSFSDGSVDRITKQFETEKELDGFAKNNLTESQRSTMAKSKQPLTVK